MQTKPGERKGRGGPRIIPIIERERLLRLEDYVAHRIQEGHRLPAIARDLGVCYATLRRELRRRGYTVTEHHELVRRPRSGQGQAARDPGAPPGPEALAGPALVGGDGQSGEDRGNSPGPRR